MCDYCREYFTGDANKSIVFKRLEFMGQPVAALDIFVNGDSLEAFIDSDCTDVVLMKEMVKIKYCPFCGAKFTGPDPDLPFSDENNKDELRKEHCYKLLQNISYSKLGHLTEFWYCQVFQELKKAEDELFVTVSKIMDIYNDPEIKGRHWWECNYGWKRSVLLEAIDAMPLMAFMILDNGNYCFDLPPVKHINEVFPGEI